MARLAIIIVSTRPGRVGPAVADWFAQVAREDGRFEVDLVDLAEVGLPLLDEPHHPRLRQYVHEHTKRWSERVEAADAFAIVTPEYNFGMPASLKNALDYLSQEWANKAVGFVSYGGISAGTRGVQMSKQVLTALRMFTLPTAVSVPFVQNFLEEGVFTPNDSLSRSAQALVDDLWTTEETLKRLR